MDAVINIGSFLNFVNSMSLSPRVKRWLGERLIHEAKKRKQSWSIKRNLVCSVVLLVHGLMLILIL